MLSPTVDCMLCWSTPNFLNHSMTKTLLPFCLTLVLSSNFLYSQNSTVFACSYGQQDTKYVSCLLIKKATSENSEAINIIDKILQPVGLKRNFVILSCTNIQNALAVTTTEGIRYVIYDNDFLSEISTLTSNWTKVGILAHEIGHHLSGHTLRASVSFEQQRRNELEADEFSGFILFKLGATLQQAQAAINLVAKEGSDTYATHPAKEKRLQAIKTGYDNAKKSEVVKYINTGNSSESYFIKAYKLTDEGRYNEALDNYTTAITLKPNFAESYVNRAQVRMMINLQDKENIISDCNAALKINPKIGVAYFLKGTIKLYEDQYQDALADFKTAILYDSSLLKDRNYILNKSVAESKINKVSIKEKSSHYNFFKIGFEKAQAGSYKEAIGFYNKAITLENKTAIYYDARGMAKASLKEYESAIKDFDTSIRLDPNIDLAYYHRGLSYQYSENYDKAVADFSVALILKPNNKEYLTYRGFNRRQSEDYDGAIKDFDHLLFLNHNDDNALLERAVTYAIMGKYQLAIDDLNKAIEINPNSEYHYYHRGLCKISMKQDKSGCEDLKKSCAMGLQEACNGLKKYCK